MKRSDVNFIVDALGFISFVFLTSTGVILYYILPAGIGRSSTIWTLDRHEWGSIHFYIALIFLIILSLHVVLHWKWIVCMLKGKPRSPSGSKAVLGIVGLLALIAIAAAPLLTPVEVAGTGGSQKIHTSEKEGSHVRIEGSMTLGEIEEASGVPVDYIKRSLQLPSSISANQKIGTLKAEYNFTMEEVRKVISEYAPQE